MLAPSITRANVLPVRTTSPLAPIAASSCGANTAPIAPTNAPKATTFTSAQAAEHHPIAHALLKVEGVASVFVVNNFATVSRKPEVAWDELAPKIQVALSELGE